MGSCCGTQKQGGKAGQQQQPGQKLHQQPQQKQPLQSNDQNNNGMQSNDNQASTKHLTKNTNERQDEHIIGSANQGQSDMAISNNNKGGQNNQHNIYSSKQNAEYEMLNNAKNDKIINGGVNAQSARKEAINLEQVQLQFNDKQETNQQNTQKNQQGSNATTSALASNKENTQLQNGIHTNGQQQEQSNISAIPQGNKNMQLKSANVQQQPVQNQGSNLQNSQQMVGYSYMEGESIDNVEQILQNKPKSQERGSQNNRSSIYKENYQQMTNTIICRNDIFIFSNHQFQKQVNNKKKGFELYCYFSEKESKMYMHELLKMQTKSTHGSTLADLDVQLNNNFSSQAAQFSNFQDWTKLLEKNQTAQVTKVLDKDSKSKNFPNQEIFQQIISMRERAWYEELVQLYKEKNSANKINMNMQETIFYKKLTIINDHFRWFVTAVANSTFNNNQFASQFEFPPQTLNLKKRKTSSVNSQSGAKLCHSDKSDGQPEQPNLKTQQSQFNQVQMQLNTQPPLSPIKKPSLQTENPYCDTLPEAFSPLWLRGFIWKGVYFRLLSKKKAKHVKCELKALKHIGLEYLQNDSSFKLNNIMNQSPIFINYLLPFISIVETSSFVIYGTPYIYSKNNSIEEGLVRQSGFNLYNAYNNTYLLKNLKESNLKLYHKIEENGGPQQPIQNIFYIINNAKDLMPRHCESNLMFKISQEITEGIVFQQPPKDGFIEISQLKKAMGYPDINFKYASLNYNQQKIEKQQEQQNQQKSSSYKLDQISFKKHGWLFKMIFMSQHDSNRFNLNKRASELLNLAQRKSKEIKNVYGNVLIFAKMLNQNCVINPALVYSEDINQILNVPNSEQLRQQKSSFSLLINEQRETYLSQTLKRQIDQLVAILDRSDVIISAKSLVEHFHKKGVNMRYAMVVYSLLKTQKAKNILGCDIVVRVLKQIISETTSGTLKKLSLISQDPILSQKKSQISNGVSDDTQEKNDIFSDNMFKNTLCRYLSLLIKGDPNSEDAVGLQEIIQGLNLYRLRTIYHSQIILSEGSLAFYQSSQFIKELISVAQQNAGVLMITCQLHLQITLSADLERNIRNDKYYFTIRNVVPKPQDITHIVYESVPYLTIKEIAYLFLIKLSQENVQKFVQIQLPSSLYKISKDQQNGLLSDAYYMPTGEILKDLISYLNCIFGNLFSLNAEQNFFLDLYIFQLFDSFFISKDDEEFVKNIMNEKIQPFLQNQYTFSAELAITIYTWIGILQETKSLLECEQSYMMALLAIHKLYGDPRGRGSTVVPWELFIAWRLSIIARLQGKKHDAEYVEELYDSIQFSMQKNIFNYYKFNHYIYWDPFKPFEYNLKNANLDKDLPSTFTQLVSLKQNQENLQPTTLSQNEPNPQQLENNLPFNHWTEYQTLDENSPIIEVLTSTLRKNDGLFKWLMQNLLIFQESGVIWEISSLRAFQLSIMQNVFHANSSCSSVSSHSDKLDQATPKSQRIESKNKGYIQSNQSGNIVQILEKDYSTFSKKDAVGVMFSWGQNTEGQMGNVYDPKQNLLSKKIKVNFPKLIVPLKDTIVTSVACGYQHSVAITYAGTVLAWGDNSHSQLGLGEKSPSSVPYPTPIPALTNIQSVSCGSEHTLALDYIGQVFSWGNGEGGLLGHGNEDICPSPKVIEALKGLNVDFIVCGGLHSLVLTKNRQVYSWGRNEGGQLGIDKKLFTNEKCYLTTPKRVKGNLEGVGVIQIAAGEAHSLALALNGQVYGWGYNMNGQIGLGMQTDTYPVYEPQLIPKLNKIEKIYSGQTFSMFMSSNKEIFCCGLNDSNQLGLEKEPIKITSTTNNILDQYKPQDQKRAVTDVFIPKKMDCFHQIPVLHVSCGHNHSLALVVADTKHYMLFAWGMHKHGQLGIGETGQNSSVPRPITYLQDVTTYSMACGSYHSLVVANDVNRILKKETIRTIKENLEKYDQKWNLSFNPKDNKYSNISEFIHATSINNNNNNNNNNNIENIAPSEEGKIDNPKSIQKANQYYALGVQFS
ncbi:hypothetical protein ABPG74_018639 [Tetrahymena malaccensis]